MTLARSSLFFLAPLLVLSCQAPQGPAPNSPTHDHHPPATSPGDGEVIGADRVPPEDKLQEGPKLDSEEGVVPSGAPPAR